MHGIDNDTNRKKIVNLVERFILVFHFLVDGEEMLYSSVDFGMNAGLTDMGPYFVDNALNILFAFRTARGDFIHQVIIGFRLQVF